MRNRYFASNIRRYIEDDDRNNRGIEALDNFITGFSCPRSIGVENFLLKNAVDFTKKGQSVTYLVFDSFSTQLVGYFTLAVKPISIRLENISKTMAKKLSRVSILDVKTMTFNTAAYLIAQLGKNYSLSKDEQIDGTLLLALATDTISKIQYSIGGVVEFLECEDNEFLLDFYAKNHFKQFDTRFVVPETGDTYMLHQLLKFI